MRPAEHHVVVHAAARWVLLLRLLLSVTASGAAHAGPPTFKPGPSVAVVQMQAPIPMPIRRRPRGFGVRAACCTTPCLPRTPTHWWVVVVVVVAAVAEVLRLWVVTHPVPQAAPAVAVTPAPVRSLATVR